MYIKREPYKTVSLVNRLIFFDIHILLHKKNIFVSIEKNAGLSVPE